MKTQILKARNFCTQNLLSELSKLNKKVKLSSQDEIYKFMREWKKNKLQSTIRDNIQLEKSLTTIYEKNRIQLFKDMFQRLTPSELKYYKLKIAERLKTQYAVDEETKSQYQEFSSEYYEMIEDHYNPKNFFKQRIMATLWNHPEVFEVMRENFGGTEQVEEAQQVEEAPKVEEKTSFDVELTGFAAGSKIKIIKEIKAMLGLGLKEAKDFVESSPNIVKKSVNKEEAAELQGKLETIGCTVTQK